LLVTDLTYYNWFGYDLTNPRKLDRLIKKLERIIRISPEYKIWADICRAGKYKCPKCGINSELMPLEVHHTPKTLYDIVEEVLNKHMENDDILELYPSDIVKEVLLLHLENKVSYEVLCKSCHEIEHNKRKIQDSTKIPKLD
jgi:predicted nucleic-acid-binding Zn-ribbon protein